MSTSAVEGEGEEDLYHHEEELIKARLLAAEREHEIVELSARLERYERAAYADGNADDDADEEEDRLDMEATEMWLSGNERISRGDVSLAVEFYTKSMSSLLQRFQDLKARQRARDVVDQEVKQRWMASKDEELANKLAVAEREIAAAREDERAMGERQLAWEEQQRQHFEQAVEQLRLAHEQETSEHSAALHTAQEEAAAAMQAAQEEHSAALHAAQEEHSVALQSVKEHAAATLQSAQEEAAAALQAAQEEAAATRTKLAQHEEQTALLLNKYQALKDEYKQGKRQQDAHVKEIARVQDENLALNDQVFELQAELAQQQQNDDMIAALQQQVSESEVRREMDAVRVAVECEELRHALQTAQMDAQLAQEQGVGLAAALHAKQEELVHQQQEAVRAVQALEQTHHQEKEEEAARSLEASQQAMRALEHSHQQEKEASEHDVRAMREQVEATQHALSALEQQAQASQHAHQEQVQVMEHTHTQRVQALEHALAEVQQGLQGTIAGLELQLAEAQQDRSGATAQLERQLAEAHQLAQSTLAQATTVLEQQLASERGAVAQLEHELGQAHHAHDRAQHQLGEQLVQEQHRAADAHAQLELKLAQLAECQTENIELNDQVFELQAELQQQQQQQPAEEDVSSVVVEALQQAVNQAAWHVEAAQMEAEAQQAHVRGQAQARVSKMQTEAKARMSRTQQEAKALVARANEELDAAKHELDAAKLDVVRAKEDAHARLDALQRQHNDAEFSRDALAQEQLGALQAEAVALGSTVFALQRDNADLAGRLSELDQHAQAVQARLQQTEFQLEFDGETLQHALSDAQHLCKALELELALHREQAEHDARVSELALDAVQRQLETLPPAAAVPTVPTVPLRGINLACNEARLHELEAELAAAHDQQLYLEQELKRSRHELHTNTHDLQSECEALRRRVEELDHQRQLDQSGRRVRAASLDPASPARPSLLSPRASPHSSSRLRYVVPWMQGEEEEDVVTVVDTPESKPSLQTARARRNSLPSAFMGVEGNANNNEEAVVVGELRRARQEFTLQNKNLQSECDALRRRVDELELELRAKCDEEEAGHVAVVDVLAPPESLARSVSRIESQRDGGGGWLPLETPESRRAQQQVDDGAASTVATAGASPVAFRLDLGLKEGEDEGSCTVRSTADEAVVLRERVRELEEAVSQLQARTCELEFVHEAEEAELVELRQLRDEDEEAAAAAAEEEEEREETGEVVRELEARIVELQRALLLRPEQVEAVVSSLHALKQVKQQPAPSSAADADVASKASQLVDAVERLELKRSAAEAQLREVLGAEEDDSADNNNNGGGEVVALARSIASQLGVAPQQQPQEDDESLRAAVDQVVDQVRACLLVSSLAPSSPVAVVDRKEEDEEEEVRDGGESSSDLADKVRQLEKEKRELAGKLRRSEAELASRVDFFVHHASSLPQQQQMERDALQTPGSSATSSSTNSSRQEVTPWKNSAYASRPSSSSSWTAPAPAAADDVHADDYNGVAAYHHHEDQQQQQQWGEQAAAAPASEEDWFPPPQEEYAPRLSWQGDAAAAEQWQQYHTGGGYAEQTPQRPTSSSHSFVHGDTPASTSTVPFVDPEQLQERIAELKDELQLEREARLVQESQCAAFESALHAVRHELYVLSASAPPQQQEQQQEGYYPPQEQHQQEQQEGGDYYYPDAAITTTTHDQYDNHNDYYYAEQHVEYTAASTGEYAAVMTASSTTTTLVMHEHHADNSTTSQLESQLREALDTIAALRAQIAASAPAAAVSGDRQHEEELEALVKLREQDVAALVAQLSSVTYELLSVEEQARRTSPAAVASLSAAVFALAAIVPPEAVFLRLRQILLLSL